MLSRCYLSQLRGSLASVTSIVPTTGQGNDCNVPHPDKAFRRVRCTLQRPPTPPPGLEASNPQLS